MLVIHPSLNFNCRLCFYEYNNMIVGYKYFEIIDNQLYTLGAKTPHNIKIEEDKIVVFSELTEQNILLRLPVNDKSIHIERTIKTGTFISYLLNKDIKTDKIKKLRVPDLFKKGSKLKISIPVFFDLNGILFYDGVLVSVKEFYIYPPDVVSSMYKQIKKGSKLKNYKKIYNLITQI